MTDTSFFFDDASGAPRAAHRVFESLINPANRERHFRMVRADTCVVIIIKEGDPLLPARLDGRMAFSMEVGGKVVDTDMTPRELAHLAENGFRRIVTHAKGDPEAYLRSLCRGTLEAFAKKAEQAVEVAVAVAMANPDASQALSGQKEWVSVAEVPGEDGGKRVSVASGVCLCVELKPKS